MGFPFRPALQAVFVRRRGEDVGVMPHDDKRAEQRDDDLRMSGSPSAHADAGHQGSRRGSRPEIRA